MSARLRPTVFCDSEVGRLERVAVASPEYFHETAPINVIQAREYAKASVDRGRLVAEHDAVRRALLALDVHVVDVPPHPLLPYQLNIRDVGVVRHDALVACHMAKAVRTPEPFWVAAWICAEHDAAFVALDGCGIEGGDIFQIGSGLVVGISERTGPEGIAQLRAALGEDDVLAVQLAPDVLHLDTAFNVVGSVAVLAPDLLLESAQFVAWLAAHGVDQIIEIGSEEAGLLATNWLATSESCVVTNRAVPKVNRCLEERGIRVVAVDMSEHHRIGGSVRCMTMPLRRQAAEAEPDGAE